MNESKMPAEVDKELRRVEHTLAPTCGEASPRACLQRCCSNGVHGERGCRV